jgi:hypothetical protein
VSGWRLIEYPAESRVDVYRNSAEFGVVMVGSLYLNDADMAELREMFGGVRA